MGHPEPRLRAARDALAVRAAQARAVRVYRVERQGSLRWGPVGWRVNGRMSVLDTTCRGRSRDHDRGGDHAQDPRARFVGTEIRITSLGALGRPASRPAIQGENRQIGPQSSPSWLYSQNLFHAHGRVDGILAREM